MPSYRSQNSSLRPAKDFSIQRVLRTKFFMILHKIQTGQNSPAIDKIWQSNQDIKILCKNPLGDAILRIKWYFVFFEHFRKYVLSWMPGYRIQNSSLRPAKDFSLQRVLRTMYCKCIEFNAPPKRLIRFAALAGKFYNFASIFGDLLQFVAHFGNFPNFQIIW